jgi:predicted helicase
MEAVVRDFGDRNPLEDPVIHFYELFLKEYDAEKRMQRGVFYTPRPVVSFIVRSVDELLRTEFGLEDGLADTTTWRELTQRFDDFEIPKGATPDHAFVQILDPATGTGTFLVEVIDLIHKTMMDKWQAEGHGAKKLEQLWNEYVPEHLLARLYGYELLMAPYAIAHMKIGLKLSETGYRFESDACARIYLTNALEPAKPFQMSFDIPALAHEAESVNALKRDHQFTVVIGNPPYAATSSNLTPELRSIVDRYRAVKGIPIRERSMLQFEKNIQDDYIKFFALTQALLEQSPFAVGGYISNHSFLDGPTLRGVRWGLLSTFNVASFIDLHGNANKKEKPPTGGPDANVFDIRQGVAVSILCRNLVKSRETVQHLDLWGTRDRKYDFLGSRTASTAGCAAITVEPPNYFIVNQKDGAEIKGWQEYVEIIDVFTKRSTGTETGFDNLLVAFDRSELEQNLARFCSSSRSDREVQDDWGIDGGHAGELLEKRSGLQDDIGQHIRSFQLRAFDFRKALLQKELLKTNSFNVMLDLGEGSPGLVTTRQTKERFSVLVVEGFTGHKCTSSYDRSYVFPLFTKSNGDLLHGKRTYLSQNILRHFGKLAESENEGLDELTLSIEVFHYVYSILSAPSYASRFGGRLKREWPRLPLTRDWRLFRSLAALGGDLASLHLLKAPVLNNHITTIEGPGRLMVEKVSYSSETVWVDERKTQGFRGVPANVWSFHVGGNQVCEKWLKDRQAKGGKNPRPGRVLTDEDIDHYQKIIVALSETIRLMGEIDEVIEQHGGWPDAFKTG